MKNLNELYKTSSNVLLNDVVENSKEVKKGDLFVCTKGITTDRHDFIDEAIKNGASALIVSKECNYNIPTIKVKNTNLELGKISKKFYNNPLKKIKLIGITGTDGKTTTASIIRNMIGNNKCGYIGTNGIYAVEKIKSENNTTPEINKIYKYLNNFVEKKLEYSTIEISSEALYRNRTNTLKLDVAVITNITEDHLNVHKNIENYISSKEKIFKLLKKDGIAVLNRDDKYYDRILRKIKNKVLTYGKDKNSDLRIFNIKEYETGTTFNLEYKKNIYKVISPLLGEFNVYNLSSAILTLISLGYSIEESISSILNIDIVDGRCEFLDFNQNYKLVLDYAHTVNGLRNILIFLNKIKKNKIITVTGSAGGREKEKRKSMGKVVLDLSDLVIFTMDDPRNEKVEDIINDMLRESESKNYIKIFNRDLAINKALSLAKNDDIVLIVGKGRDNYMAIGKNYIEYSDYEVIQNYFKSIDI